MDVAMVTGSAGLVGSESVRFFSDRGFLVVGIDNDMRRVFFGPDASTAWQRERLLREVPGYRHFDVDIRDSAALNALFAEFNRDIRIVVHSAAQPSHDWAARDPHTDFTVNANGTLAVLEATRRHCPAAVFIFTSTNKVYGDRPNRLPLVEQETRWEVAGDHPYAEHGIDESMTVDQSTHSLMGVSKAAADLMVQEYGRYFGMKTGTFRGGCVTGPRHAGTTMHGFLAFLMRCAVTGQRYTVLGYQAKQVRDNIHAADLVSMFWHFYLAPRPGEVFNAGGSRRSHCSMLEAIALCEEISGRRVDWQYREGHRIGDHRWYVSDVRKFRLAYPEWEYRYGLRDTLVEIYDALRQRFDSPGAEHAPSGSQARGSA